LKFHVYPDDRVPVKNVAILLEEGEPSISVVFDLEAAETRARQMAVDLPSIDEILDHDAIQRAVEGVPKEQMEAALKPKSNARLTFTTIRRRRLSAEFLPTRHIAGNRNHKDSA